MKLTGNSEVPLPPVRSLRNVFVCLFFSAVVLFLLAVGAFIYLVISSLADQQEGYPFSVVPEGVHLSLGANHRQMVVTWTTPNRTSCSVVWYGLVSEDHLKKSNSALDKMATGNCSALVDAGPQRRTVYIHRVLLRGLMPGSLYQYAVGSSPNRTEKEDFSTSQLFSFRTFPSETSKQSWWSPRLAIFGDVSTAEWRTFDQLFKEVHQKKNVPPPVDMIFHLGDIAYDLHSEEGVSVCPGNHEAAQNFSHYDGRFSMVSSVEDSDSEALQINNHFYSFNLGRAHFIAYSTELHFFKSFGASKIAQQFEWLEADLAAANRPEARVARPWIVTIGHRPMYSHFAADYDKEGAVVREGDGSDPKDSPFGMGFERLFLSATASTCSWPATFTTTSGRAAGNRRMSSSILPRELRPPYNAVVRNEYSYTVLTVVNGSHLQVEQVDEGGARLDEFVMRKDRPSRRGSEPISKLRTIYR
ncbi:hypothetical protein TYRP_020380 [Tyrophagus putrescentiae]|nr:hypothetical protein TYRP_020380 [Tyrophagus putrescentiae]